MFRFNYVYHFLEFFRFKELFIDSSEFRVFFFKVQKPIFGRETDIAFEKFKQVVINLQVILVFFQEIV